MKPQPASIGTERQFPSTVSETLVPFTTFSASVQRIQDVEIEDAARVNDRTREGRETGNRSLVRLHRPFGNDEVHAGEIVFALRARR